MARATGLFGAVYLGSTPTKIADVYEWTFDTTTDVLPCDIKGDIYHRFTPDATGAKFTAKRRIGSGFSVFAPLVQDAGVNATQGLFRLDLVDASGSFVQIQGQGYADSGSLSTPYNAVAGDEYTVTFDGAWTMT